MDVASRTEKLTELGSLLEHIPNAGNGDLTALHGFMSGVKPASQLPAHIDAKTADSFLPTLRSCVPDTTLKLVSYKGAEIYLAYSPSAILQRMRSEPHAVAWLGIGDDSVEQIIEKMHSNPQVEGFVLGFPEEALISWQRINEIHSRSPSFERLISDDSILPDLTPEEAEKLLALRRRYSQFPHTLDIYAFFGLPNIRPFIEGLYRKYSQLSDDEINFIFSFRGVHTDYMNYNVSSVVERELATTKDRAKKAPVFC